MTLPQIAPPAPPVLIPPTEQPLCILFKNHNETFSNDKITWLDLKAMAAKPNSMAKNDAPCIASQLSGYKTKESAEAHNQMSLLWEDIDEGNLSVDELKPKLAMLGITSSITYSTASSMRFNKKTNKINGKRWRVLIPLTQPIDCATWILTQEALANLLDGDSSATRVQQILYAPNNPVITDNRETQHYEYHIQEGEAFNSFKPKAPSKLLDGQIDPITAYNGQHSIESELEAIGCIPPRHERGKWVRANSNSGKGSISVKHGKSYHHSSNDPMSDSFAHDAYDLMCHSKGFTQKEGVAYAARACKVNPDDPSSLNVNEHNWRIKQKCRDSFTGHEKDLADKIEWRLNNVITDSSNCVNWGNIKDTCEGSFINQSKNKVIALNKDGQMPQYFVNHFMERNRKSLFGSMLNHELLNELVTKHHNSQGIEDELELKKAVKISMADITKIVDYEFLIYLENYRQRSSIHYSTDMFAIKPCLVVESDYAHLISVHKPFAVQSDVIDWNCVMDYMQHFPELGTFLELLVASRFAQDRKQAFFWLKAVSDWGKGFLTAVFKELGILTEMSIKEIESALEGNPIGKQPIDFMNSWILFVDEFKAIKSEVKLLTSSISGSPKNQMMFQADLFMKLFASAEEVESMAGDKGVEKQFSNRFSLFDTLNVSLNDRPLFTRSKVTYFNSIKNYVAFTLNGLVDQYKALGRIESANKGDRVLAEYHAKNNLSIHYGSLDDSVLEIAQELKQEIINYSLDIFRNTTEFFTKNVFFVKHNGVECLLVKNVDKFISDYINETISDSERIKVKHKKSDIRAAMDDSDRTNKSNSIRVNHKNDKGIYEETSKLTKGIIIYHVTSD